MDDRTATLEELKERIREFVKARDWKKFHSPKNLSMSLAIEAAELMELFQWLSIEESRKVNLDESRRHKIREEVADIATYLLDLCIALDIDLSSAMADKLRVNANKYPVDAVKGKADKYTKYESK